MIPRPLVKGNGMEFMLFTELKDTGRWPGVEKDQELSYRWLCFKEASGKIQAGEQAVGDPELGRKHAT